MSHSHPAVPSAEPAPLRVGLLGFGTVGSGTCKVLTRNAQLIRARAGRSVELRMISTRTPERIRQGMADGIALVANAGDLVTHPDVDVVVEAIGGCGMARDLVLQAIGNGKHVVTANKAMLALHGEEIFDAAQRHGVTVAFEGAVAVSIPIIKALREGLAANDVQWIAGIINGTSNFILTQMRDQGVSFHDALAQAQRLGYAEADPSFDVEGVDAAHKLALLASIGFGMPLQFNKIHIQGISSLSVDDFRAATALRHTIKLVATARKSEHGVELHVQPTLIPRDNLLSKVDGSMNAVVVKSDAAGLTMYYGAGAGSEQTASAVVADLMDIARLDKDSPQRRVPPLGFHERPLVTPHLIPHAEITRQHAVRIQTPRPREIIAQTMALLAHCGIDVQEPLHVQDPGESLPGQLMFLVGAVDGTTLDDALAPVTRWPMVEKVSKLPLFALE